MDSDRKTPRSSDITKIIIEYDIFLSSIKVNGEETRFNQYFNENSELNPLDNYAKSKVEALDESFANQITADKVKFLETYDAIQKVVVLLKVDMLQALNINVDYTDADGD